MLRIRLLGSFEIIVNGSLIPASAWKRRKAAAIIKLLALTPSHRLHREQVMNLLWPYHHPQKAANTLYQTLHTARRTLQIVGSTNVLVLRDQVLHLTVDAEVWIDVEAFEQAAIKAKSQRNAEAFQAAIDLYAGELLPDDRYDAWASDRREALQQTYIALLEDLAALFQQRGDYPAGIEVAQRIVMADPCYEVGHQVLMRLYALTGQRPQALRQFQILRETLARELDIAPELESEHLHQQIRSGELSPVSEYRDVAGVPTPPRRHNLPAPVSSFIGRAREKAEVERLLATTRLLTLVGPGGAGKTRLAYETASDMLPNYPDGVWTVELAALADSELIPQAVATAVGIREAPGQPLIDTLSSYLRTRRALLVLDNCEHLIDAAAHLVNTLLANCPDVQVLATSREAFQIIGELSWPVPSLSLPDPREVPEPKRLGDYEAIRLFVDRAAAVSPAFSVTEENAQAIAELCYRLDGMPLAIELAAARTRTLSVHGIVERLNDRFRLLTGGSRTALTRQQTLRAALDWSYDLLSEQEQILFTRLSVFAGGFDLDAAQAVCGGKSLDPHDVLDLLTQLVARSLVSAGQVAGGTRYYLLETMREYGHERLAKRSETAIVRQWHSDYFLALAKEADRLLRGLGHAEGLAKLSVEHDNLRVAMDWYAHLADAGNPEPGSELAGALYWFWQLTGHVSEGRNRLDYLLARSEGQRTAARAHAIIAACWLAISVGEYMFKHGHIEEAVHIFRQIDDRDGLATALLWSSFVTLFGGRIEEARIQTEESLALFIQTGNQWGRALARQAQGFVASEAGEYIQAETWIEESLKIFRDLNDQWGIVTAQSLLGHLMYRRGELENAREYVTEVVGIAREREDRWLLVQSLTLLGEIARAQGDYATTSIVCEESLRTSREINHVILVAWTLRELGYVDCAEGRPKEARERFNESLTIFRQQDYPLGVICCLAGLAAVAVAGSQPRTAATLLGAVQSALESLNLSFAPADRGEAEHIADAVRATIDEHQFNAAMAQGWSMTLDQAIEHACSHFS